MITVLAVLVGVLLPALSSARTTAREARSLSNLRSIGQLFALYADVERQAYPVAEEFRLYPFGCDGVRIGFPYWDIRQHWPALLQEVAPWSNSVGMFLSPGSPRRLDDETCAWPTSYVYSNSFVGRPPLWRPGSVADESLRKGTFVHEVAFPVQKALLWDGEIPYRSGPLGRSGPDLAEPCPILFADTHAEVRVPAEASTSVPNPFQPGPFGVMRLHNTLDGVYGRDY